MITAKGLLTVQSCVATDGHPIALEDAVRYGWLIPQSAPVGWGVNRDELCLGENLFVDNGRQLMAYAFGGLSPYQNNSVTSFGVGTGITTPTTLDIQLEAPLSFSSGQQLKAIDSVDFPVPYTARVSLTLDTGDCNGYLLTEFGLFTANGGMLARKVSVAGINKVSSARVSLLWRIRF